MINKIIRITLGLGVVAMIALGVAGCSGAPSAAPAPYSAPTATKVVHYEPTPTATKRPTLRPTSTPRPPSVSTRCLDYFEAVAIGVDKGRSESETLFVAGYAMQQLHGIQPGRELERFLEHCDIPNRIDEYREALAIRRRSSEVPAAPALTQGQKALARVEDSVTPIAFLSKLTKPENGQASHCLDAFVEMENLERANPNANLLGAQWGAVYLTFIANRHPRLARSEMVEFFRSCRYKDLYYSYSVIYAELDERGLLADASAPQPTPSPDAPLPTWLAQAQFAS